MRQELRDLPCLGKLTMPLPHLHPRKTTLPPYSYFGSRVTAEGLIGLDTQQLPRSFWRLPEKSLRREDKSRVEDHPFSSYLFIAPAFAPKSLLLESPARLADLVSVGGCCLSVIVPPCLC